MSELTESKLFKSALGITEETPKEETKEEIKEEAKTPEPPKEESKAEIKEDPKAEDPKTEVKQEAKKEPAKEEKKEPEAEAPKAKTYDEWFEENESALKAYLIEKNTDYSKMDSESLLLKKYTEQNPELSSKEIKDLLADDFSLDEKKIEIDEDIMSEDEVARAKAHNKEIDKAHRKLNAEAKKAQKEFESRKESIEKPVYAVPEVKKEEGSEVERYTPEEFMEKLAEEDRATAETQAKQWADTIEEKVTLPEKFSYKDLEVDLTEDEQKAVKQALLGYVAKPGDEINYVKDGAILWNKLTEDITKIVLLDKLIDAANEKGKKAKDEKLVNYQKPITNSSTSAEPETEKQLTTTIWKSMKGKSEY